MTEAVNALNQEHRTQVDIINGTITEIQNDMDTLKGEYEEFKDAVGGALDSVFSSFDIVEVKVEKSVSDMIKSLDSQLSYMDTYQQNMKWLSAQGVDEGLVQKLSDGSMESAQILQALVDDGGAHLKEFSDKFSQVEEGKENFSTAMADLVIDFDGKMAELEERMDSAVLAMDKANDAYVAGVNTISGFIQGAGDMHDAVIITYDNMAADAIRVFKRRLEENSPSRVFEESGVNTMLGAIKGATSQKSKLTGAYKDLATSAISAYEDEVSKDVSTPQTATGWMKAGTDPARIAASIPETRTRRAETNAQLVLDGQVIGRVLLPYIEQESQRIGVQIGGRA